MAARARFRRLMARARPHPDADLLARMIASWQGGGGVLPPRLGLPPHCFRAMLAFHFPGAEPVRNGKIPKDITAGRLDEVADVYRLLLGWRAGLSLSEVWVARLLATACLGQDHLWQDLGLWSRDELSRLIRRNFPRLAARNVNDMKWKKFLYRQLCEAEGIRGCLAPSCGVCTDYDRCFGPES